MVFVISWTAGVYHYGAREISQAWLRPLTAREKASWTLFRFKIQNFKRILRYLYGELNLDKIKNELHGACKLRDKSNEPN